jgi:hypothetical protein
MNPVNYSIVGSQDLGEWMECDYADMNSDQIEVYNLPLKNNDMLKGNTTVSSLTTIVMIFVIFISMFIAYFSIPFIYENVLKLFIITDTTKDASKEDVAKIKKFDIIAFIVWIVLIVIFIFTGLKENSTLMIFGIYLGILLMICYIIILYKKGTDDDFPLKNFKTAVAADNTSVAST